MIDIYLSHFEVIKPKFRVPQKDLIDWLIKAHLNAERINHAGSPHESQIQRIEKILHRYAVTESQISARYIESDDVLHPENSEACVYQLDSENPRGSDIQQRTHFFSERALSIFQKIYRSKSRDEKPDHLIHVTCTGYTSPSAAQRIVSEPHWNKVTDITHAYHMGCYAAIPAIRIAQGLLNYESKGHKTFSVDLFHTEMCSLHLNPLAHTPEQMIVQTLFADGHIKYSLKTTQDMQKRSLRLVAILEKIIPNSEADMSWFPTAWGMQMNLSREVPIKIKGVLEKFYLDLLSKAGLSSAEVTSRGVFAVHPGGPKIIDAVQGALQLSENQVTQSRKVLFERGNMSSATLPHIWLEVLDHGYSSGTPVISFAFGPGLTLFGAVFEVC